MLGVILLEGAKTVYVSDNEGCGNSAERHKVSNLIHTHKLSNGSSIRLRLSAPLCNKCDRAVNSVTEEKL